MPKVRKEIYVDKGFIILVTFSLHMTFLCVVVVVVVAAAVVVVSHVPLVHVWADQDDGEFGDANGDVDPPAWKNGTKMYLLNENLFIKNSMENRHTVLLLVLLWTFVNCNWL